MARILSISQALQAQWTMRLSDMRIRIRRICFRDLVSELLPSRIHLSQEEYLILQSSGVCLCRPVGPARIFGVFAFSVGCRTRNASWSVAAALDLQGVRLDVHVRQPLGSTVEYVS